MLHPKGETPKPPKNPIFPNKPPPPPPPPKTKFPSRIVKIQRLEAKIA